MPEEGHGPFTPYTSRKYASEEIKAATEERRLALARRQAAQMEDFWSMYVKDDRRLVLDLCQEFEQYTVEMFLFVPLDYVEYFEREVESDAYVSSLKGFNAWDALKQARYDMRGEHSTAEGLLADISLDEDEVFLIKSL